MVTIYEIVIQNIGRNDFEELHLSLSLQKQTTTFSGP